MLVPESSLPFAGVIGAVSLLAVVVKLSLVEGALHAGVRPANVVDSLLLNMQLAGWSVCVV